MTKSSAPKMKHQQASTFHDQKCGEEDDGPQRRRPTIRITATKMEDQHALTLDDQKNGSKEDGPQATTTDDQKHGAEDGGPVFLDDRRSDARRRRCRTCKRQRPTIRNTAPKMDDQQAPTPDDQKHAAKNEGPACADA